MALPDNPLRVPLALQLWRYNDVTGVVVAVSDEMPVAFVAAGRRGVPQPAGIPAELLPGERFLDLTERIGPLIAAAPLMRDALVLVARAMKQAQPSDPQSVHRSVHPWSSEAKVVAEVLSLLGIVP